MAWHHITWIQYVSLKHWYFSTSLHHIISQKAVIFIFTNTGTSNLAKWNVSFMLEISEGLTAVTKSFKHCKN
jgi:hypothetical protein